MAILGKTTFNSCFIYYNLLPAIISMSLNWLFAGFLTYFNSFQVHLMDIEMSQMPQNSLVNHFKLKNSSVCDWCDLM